MIQVGNVQRTRLQVSRGEAVLDVVAGLSGASALQAGVFPLGGLQHVVAAQTLQKGKKRHLFDFNDSYKVWAFVSLQSFNLWGLLRTYSSFSLLLKHYYLGVLDSFDLW